MFTTIDIHVADDTVVEVNDSGNGIVIREATSYEPRLNLFLGTEDAEIVSAGASIINTIDELLKARASR